MALPHGQPHQMPVSPAAPMCPVRTEHRHRHAAHCFAEPWQPWAGTLQYTELCTTHLTDPRFWNLAIIPSAMRDLIILAASTAGMLRLWPSPSRLLNPAHLHSLTCQKTTSIATGFAALHSTNWSRPDSHTYTYARRRGIVTHTRIYDVMTEAAR